MPREAAVAPASHHHHHHRRRRPPPPMIPPLPYYDGSLLSSRHPLPMFLPIFVLFFALLALLSFYVFRDLLRYLTTTWAHHHRRRRQPTGAEAPPPGLDPAVLASFPTLPYAAVRGAQDGRDDRDCVVCLTEFEGGDAVRLLTVCRHAFHPGCIDPWLAAQTTCPVCRSDLRRPPDLAALLAVQGAVDADAPHVVELDGRGEGYVALATMMTAEGEDAAAGGGGGGETGEEHAAEERIAGRGPS